MPFSNRVAYGIDPTEAGLVIVEARRVRGGVRLTSVPSVSGWSRKPKAVVAAGLPLRQSITRRLVAPFSSIRKARRVFPSLLDIQLPFPVESCVACFTEVARTAAGQVETVALAARKEDVTQHLQELATLGLDPDILDHEGLALWSQSVEEMPNEANSPRLIVHLGSPSCMLVVGVGHRFEASYPVPAALPDLLKGEVSALASLRRRIQQAMHGLGDRPATPSHWVWTGQGATDQDGLRRLRETLHAGDHRHLVPDHPETFLASALARRALLGKSLDSNFRAGSLAAARQVGRAQTRMRTAAVAGFSAALWLCLVNAGWRAAVEMRKDRLQRSITETAVRLAGMDVPRGQELMVVDRVLDERAATLEPILEVFRPSLAEQLRVVLELAARSGITMENLSLKPDRVTLQGAGLDWDRCRALQPSFEQLGYAVTIELNDAGADELVHFTLQGTLAP